MQGVLAPPYRPAVHGSGNFRRCALSAFQQSRATSTDFRGDLSAFRVPTLIIHGTEDKTVPIDVSSRAAAKGIAGCTLIEYEGAPHGLFATHKARLTKDLLDFTAP
jgi:pimeloyl-ACP methyl ester carboxylesterase